MPRRHRVGDTVSVQGEPAYLALLDLATYEKDRPDWDYGSLTRAIVAQANAGRIVAWGCPELELSVRVTDRALGRREAARAGASFSARLSTAGSVCLASYTSLTMGAQFADEGFPGRGDHLFELEPGEHRVDVHRLFAHRAGAQFPDEELEGPAEYVVVLSKPTRGWKPTRRTWVPWALKLAQK